MARAAAGLPGRRAIVGGRDRRVSKRGRQLVETGLVKTHQRFRYMALLVEKKECGNGLWIVGPREFETAILHYGIGDRHLPDKFAGAGIVILGESDNLDPATGKRVEIGKSQLAGGTIRLKKDQQRPLAGLISGDRRVWGERHALQDSFNRASGQERPVVPPFKLSDFGFVLQGHANFVQSFQQTSAAKWLNDEISNEATVTGDLTLSEVNGQVEVPGFIAGFERGNFRAEQDYSQNSVLDAVVGEDIGEGRRDDCAESVVP